MCVLACAYSYVCICSCVPASVCVSVSVSVSMCVCQREFLVCVGMYEKVCVPVLCVCQYVHVNVYVSGCVRMCREVLAHCVLDFTYLT